jgi:hypothetical protein
MAMTTNYAVAESHDQVLLSGGSNGALKIEKQIQALFR